jgi:hypothetical protein
MLVIYLTQINFSFIQTIWLFIYNDVADLFNSGIKDLRPFIFMSTI